jgi:hypothetical protein
LWRYVSGQCSPIRKRFALSEGSQFSPACPFDKSVIEMMGVEHRWNLTDGGRRSKMILTREEPGPVPFCPPQTSHKLARIRTRDLAVYQFSSFHTTAFVMKANQLMLIGQELYVVRMMWKTACRHGVVEHDVGEMCRSLALRFWIVYELRGKKTGFPHLLYALNSKLMEILDCYWVTMKNVLVMWRRVVCHFTRVSQNPAVSNRPEVDSRFFRNVGILWLIQRHRLQRQLCTKL